MGKALATQGLSALALTATELARMHPEWPNVMIEDYLSRADDLEAVAEITDQKEDKFKTVVNVSFADSPYYVSQVEAAEVIFDSTDGDIIAYLGTGEEGRRYRMTNVGSANKVELVPETGELLFGSTSENIYAAETLVLTYGKEKGWW